MTKGKRATALYEVIHRDKRYAGNLRQSPLLTSKPPAPKPANNSVAFKPSPPKPPRRPAKELIAPHLIRLREKWTNLQPILVRLRKTIIEQSPILGGTCTAFLVIACVTVARHYTNTTPAAYASLDRIIANSPNPKVLDLAGLPRHTPALAEIPADAAGDLIAQPATSVSAPVARTINLNYMLVQAYRDEKTATDAKDFLDKNGIPCTIEREVRDWHKGYYYLVGLQGFPRISSPDYIAYRTRIETLSTEFAPHNIYKGFAPQAVKWDRAE